MARLAGSKDKNPRKRRKSTPAEKAKREKQKKKKKQDRAKAAKAAMVAAIAGPSTEAPQEDDWHDDVNQNEPEVVYEEINAPDANGTTDFGDVDAVLDDEYEAAASQVDTGVMKDYLKAIMKRHQFEDSTNFPALNDTKWLKPFLESHGNWIRSECAKLVCEKLNIQYHEQEYYRDVRLWFPDLEGGLLCTPTCPTCKQNDQVRKHSYPLDHPGRRVVSFNTHYYIMSRQYLCKRCNEENDSRKRQAAGGKFEKIQFTTMGYNDETLANLPGDLYYKFPAVLSHRAALDRSVMQSLRPLLDKGLRPEGLAEWLLELHSLQYTSDYLSYELRLEQQLASPFSQYTNTDPPAMFSKFNDRKRYNGATPSSGYLSAMYKREHELIRPHLNQENKKISVSQLSIDASAKVPKKLSQYNGKRVYETLQTATNEFGQIRVQALTGSDSHEQLEPSLTAMAKTMEERGQAGPEYAFTDNPSRDKSFLLRKFPSLRKKQAELDAIADKLNTEIQTDGSSELDDMDLSVQEEREEVSTTTQCETTASDDIASLIQVVEARDINTKIDAMRESVENGNEDQVYCYALDCEWDTVPTRAGNGYRKVGKVAIMQVAYTLDGVTRALILKLPRSNDKLPIRLQSFLKDKYTLFVGFNVGNDFALLGADYGDSLLKDKVNYRNLGTMARERDIVQRGNHRCDEIVQLVLGYAIDKSEDVRCSKWSTSQLSSAQVKYAALDVIKPLEVYYKLSAMPDLSQRIDPNACKPGVLVDVVPPHAGNNRQKPGLGFRVADLATRGAIGTVVAADRVSNPPGVSPGHAKTGTNTVVVEITEVLAPSLAVPKHHIRTGNAKRKACLRDLQGRSEGSFQIVLPLTMLREHAPSVEVRTYNEVPSVHRMTVRITPPNPANREQDESSETDFDAAINDRTEDDSTAPAELEDLIEDDDEVNDSNLDADLNANYEIQSDHIQAMTEAAESAENAERDQSHPGNTNLMHCDNLDPAPNIIKQVFSAVLGDPYHGGDRMKIPVRHEYKKPFKVALSRAWLQWNEKNLSDVKAILKEHGWTDEEIDNKMYFQHSFFQERVERVQLPPRQLYWRVRAVFVVFGNKVDSKTGKPLFNKAAWAKANGVLKEILLGFYSDPPGARFYRFQLNSDGSIKTDKYGIKLIRCCRGTPDVENAHKHYHTIFRYTAGIEQGDCLLSERRHRHNQRMAVLKIPNYPRLGHYNTWQIDKLQILVEKNHGVLLFFAWVNSSDFGETAESYVTVAMHSEELDIALKAAAENVSEKVKDGYTGDLRFLCRQLGVPIPFLPVDGKAEYKLFTRMLLDEVDHFDENKMALLWMNHVDGVDVFPKLPHQLRSYHKRWERNRRVQSAVKNMKSDLAALDELNNEQLPPEMNFGNDSMDLDVIDGEAGISDGMSQERGLLHFPTATMPFIPQPTLQGIRPNIGMNQISVGLERIGGHFHSDMLPPMKLKHGERGKDRKKRKQRRCGICVEANRLDLAKTCSGKGGRHLCEYM